MSKRGGPSLHQTIMREAAAVGGKKRGPTPTQVAALKRLARDGEFIHFLSGSQGNAFWHGDIKTVSVATIHALWRGGWIASTGEHGKLEYRITPAGRAALSETRGEK